MFKRLALLGLGALAAVALAFPSAAGAAGSTVTKLPINLSSLDVCTNEYVDLTGTFTVESQSFVDSASMFHEGVGTIRNRCV